MPSTLGFALLGLLARRPSTGYELSRRMDRPVGFFWTAKHSQIYPELKRLESAGLTEAELIDGPGPRPTKRYSLTERGMRELTAWVSADAEPQQVRDADILKVWSIWVVDPGAAAALVHRMREAHLARLHTYEADLADVETDHACRDPRTPLFASRATLVAGVRSRRAALQWCDWLLGELGGWPVPATAALVAG
jgi:DNA-binding PadR family transcriptional regulator